jgi:hypothetical protein
MERTKIFPTTKKQTNLKPKKNLKNILHEYSLKRNTFNPQNISPNIFLDKLELRMKLYYNNL